MPTMRALALVLAGLLGGGAGCDSPTAPAPLADGTFELSTTGEIYGAEFSGEATARAFDYYGNPTFQIQLIDREPKLPRSKPELLSYFVLESSGQRGVGTYKLVPFGSAGPGRAAADEVVANWDIPTGQNSWIVLTPLHGTIRITESTSTRVVGEIDAEFVAVASRRR